MKRTGEYIYYCGLVLGCLLPLAIAQYDEELVSTDPTTVGQEPEPELDNNILPPEDTTTEIDGLLLENSTVVLNTTDLNWTNETNETVTTESSTTEQINVENSTVTSNSEESTTTGAFEYPAYDFDYRLPPSYDYSHINDSYGSVSSSLSSTGEGPTSTVSSMNNSTNQFDETFRLPHIVPYSLGHGLPPRSEYAYRAPGVESSNNTNSSHPVQATLLGGLAYAPIPLSDRSSQGFVPYSMMRSGPPGFPVAMPLSFSISNPAPSAASSQSSPSEPVMSRTKHRSDVNEPERIVTSTKRSTTAAKTRKNSSSVQQRMTTARGKEKKPTTPSTTTTEGKRFRSMATAESKRTETTRNRLGALRTTNRKLRAIITPSGRGRQFRLLHRTRTSRTRTRTSRRYRNLRRTRATRKRSPLSKPRFRVIAQRPRVIDYDFLYF